MRRFAVAALACWLAAGAAAPAVRAQGDDPDSTAAAWEREVAAERSWLGRLLHRYFGRAPRTGEELAGRAEKLVDRYARWAGRRIDVVIIHPVLRFDREREVLAAAEHGALGSLATPLWSYTREGIVRQYLLFDRGDRLDPYKLADSERMLRQLEYMGDVRLVVVPIGDGDSVAVVVETLDRWPFGVSGKVIDRDRYDAGFRWTNGLGRGLRLEGKVVVHRGRDPSLGYRGTFGKENLAGTFVDARLEYEDTWRQLTRGVTIDRRSVHPAIDWVGGYRWESTDDRDNDDVPRGFDRNDTWVGRVFLLGQDEPGASAPGAAARRLLTPALSVGRWDFRARPEVGRDTLRAYHDRRTWLAGLTWERRVDYRTSYLFRMGETEDIPGGLVLKISGGYEDGEFLKRTLAFAEAAYVRVSGGGAVFWFGCGGGGHVRDARFEDGVVEGRLGWITPLLGEGRWRHRLYSRLAYVRGLDRTTGGGIVLGDRSGIRDLSNTAVLGQQRLVLKLESRLFTPWRLVGFETMLFAYADVGIAAGERDPLLERKIYTSTGLGVRLGNPDLVLPTFEIRAGMVTNVEDRSFSLAVDLGNVAYPEIERPGARPGTVAFR